MKSLDYWKYDNPNYPKADWLYEVCNGDTLQGYYEWLYARLKRKSRLKVLVLELIQRPQGDT